MKIIIKGIFLLGLGLAIASCSRKKNTFLSRNWHAITAEYNTLYNGNLALELGKEELIANYHDNYWNILPVERLQVREEVILPGNSKNPNFSLAEEKAVKAIQQHAMLINGREHNPQIDEAYLLLGKARYYDQRFIPALEAFNYILHKYPLSNSINQAMIWREKTNMRLEFNQIALKNLKELLEHNSLKEEERTQALATLAQAYINLSMPDSAVAPITKSAEFAKNKDKKGRYLFIKGQLYNFLGKKDSAIMAFDEVIALKRKIPRVYRINAYIQKINSLEPSPENDLKIAKLLAKLEVNRENRPFLDKIYFQLAQFHYQRDSVPLAMEYYNKSLRASLNNAFLQSLNYKALGNITFEAANYQAAGAYYDSTLLKLPENSREYRFIKKKRDNLEEVIYYEDIARKNDSILYLSDLSEEEQLEFFTQYTNTLKAEAIAATQDQDKTNFPAAPALPPGFMENTAPTPPGMPVSSFYFYNPATVARGIQEFLSVWGNRPLIDNWRVLESSTSALQENEEQLPLQLALIENNPKYNPEIYISQIPHNPEVLDSLQQERNFAYYQLGILYKEKFDEYALAAEKLELLLKGNPQERLILPAKYNLYKIYSALGDLIKAEAVKSDIIFQYPDSRYATILQNPEALLNNENSPQALYNDLYALYEDQQYEEVIEQSADLVKQFPGETIVPKLELLKAMAMGRLKGFDAYKEALNYVALTFPQSEEGKKAQDLYTNALPAMAEKSFVDDAVADSFKLIFPFKKAHPEVSAEFKKELKILLDELEYQNLDISTDVYNPEAVFVVIHGFPSVGSALGFKKLLQEEENSSLKKNSHYISSSNYRIIQIHKNFSAYLEDVLQE